MQPSVRPRPRGQALGREPAREDAGAPLKRHRLHLILKDHKSSIRGYFRRSPPRRSRRPGTMKMRRVMYRRLSKGAGASSSSRLVLTERLINQDFRRLDNLWYVFRGVVHVVRDDALKQ